jgi:hypothetical protein
MFYFFDLLKKKTYLNYVEASHQKTKLKPMKFMTNKNNCQLHDISLQERNYHEHFSDSFLIDIFEIKILKQLQIDVIECSSKMLISMNHFAFELLSVSECCWTCPSWIV